MLRFFASILFSFFVFIWGGCKKYENDDKRYFKTACGRVAKKWELYKITDRNGADLTKDTVEYYLYDPAGNITNVIKYTYDGMILEFDHVSSWLCAEVGLNGSVKCLNRPFFKGTYSLRDKREIIKMDVRPLEGNPARYFIDDYTIYKMTADELIFTGGKGNEFCFRVSNK